MSKNTNLSFLTDFLTADIVNSRVGMNNVSPQNTFDVTGTGKFSGVLTLGSTVSNGTYTYTLPSATGTLALTSDIPSVSGYVPYTGAAASVNLGVYSITANAINSAGSGSTAGQINLRSDAFFSLVNGYGSIASGTTNQFNLYQTTGAGVFRGAILSLNSITESATRTFTFPDASGTIALTSSIPANPVGGTGTTNYLPKFTGASTIGNSQIFDNGTNVGLNTITPLTVLDIATSANNALGIGNASDTISSGDLIGAISFISRDASVNSSGGVSNIRSYATATYNTGGVSADLRFYVSNSLSNASQDILFGTEAMRIFSDGNLHIGPAPASNNGARLQVSGQLSIIDNINNSPLNWSSNYLPAGGTIGYLYSDGDNVGITNVFDFGAGYEGILLNTSSSSINFYTDGVSTPRLTIASTGAATFSSSVTASDAISNDFSASGTFAASFTNSNSTGYGLYVRGGSNVREAILIADNAGNQNIRLYGDGSATFSSSVTATNYFASSVESFRTYNDNGYISFFNSSNTTRQGYIQVQSTAMTLAAEGGSSFMAFTTAGTERMRIFNDGNVLIQSGGTFSNNGARLQVSGTGRFTDIVTVISSSSTGYVAQTTANSVYPYFRWIANNRSYWAAAIDSGTDATFKIGGGNTIGSSPFLTIDSGTNASTFTTTLAVTGEATFSSSVNLTSIFPVLTVQGTASGIHTGSSWSVSANQDGTGRTIIATAGQGRAMYFENNGDIVIPNNSLQVGSNVFLTGGANQYLKIQSSTGDYSYLYLKSGLNDGYLLQNFNGSTGNGVSAGAMYFYMSNSQQFEFNWGGVSKIQFTSAGAATFSSGIATNGYTASTSYAALFNGNVGIGTNAPEATGLTVAGGGILVSLDSGAARKVLELYATSTGAKVSSTYVGASSYGSLELLTSNEPRLTITSGGNVLIGTTTDNGFKFDVAGTGRFNGNALTVSGSNPSLTLTTSDSTLYSYVALNAGTASNVIYTLANSYVTTGPYIAGALALDGTTSAGISIAATNASGLIRFYTGGTTEKMRITSGGYFKASSTGAYVGSTGPYHEIIAGGNDSDLLFTRHTAASPYGIEINFSGASPNNTTNWFTYYYDTTNVKFIVYSNGNVVNRNGSYGTISDVKYKENIVNASEKLDDILKLQVRNFNLIGDDKKQIGFIAQEFEEVFPSMVDTSIDKNTNEEYKSIKTSVLIPMLVKAIQEQQVQIDKLKNK